MEQVNPVVKQSQVVFRGGDGGSTPSKKVEKEKTKQVEVKTDLLKTNLVLKRITVKNIVDTNGVKKIMKHFTDFSTEE